jgi:predicted component of type VI protein secretion system
MAYLLEKKPAAGAEARKFDLPESEAAVIGRSASKCNVPVPGAAVSGIHATISRGPEAFLLKDLGSTNGTTLDGAPVEADKDVKVYRGDEIQFGDFAVTLEGEDVPSRPADATKPAPAPAPPPAPVPVPVAGAVPPPAGVSEKYAEETHVNVAPVRHNGSPLDFAPRTAGTPSGAPMPGQFRRRGGGAKLWGTILVGVVIVVAVLVYLVFGNL